jgi:glutathione S-transferase
MYAPVVSPSTVRSASLPSRDYVRAVMAQPAWNEWRDAAQPWVLPHDEVDWPEVKRQS